MKKQKRSKVVREIFKYDNYRVFLAAYFKEQKQVTHGFTMSGFSKKAGFLSHSFLRFIVRGERNVSEKSVSQICSTIGLSSTEADYFTALVWYNQAEKSSDKTKCFEQLKNCRKRIATLIIDDATSRFYEKWYYPVVKELVITTTWGGDFRKLGKMLKPSITFFQAKEAVEFLLEVGLIEKSLSGVYSTTAKHVTSESVPMYVKKDVRRDVLQMGVESVELSTAKERHTAYTTLTLDEDAFVDIEEMLNEVREKIIKRADSCKNGDVYEAVFQLFPVTNVQKRDLKIKEKE